MPAMLDHAATHPHTRSATQASLLRRVRDTSDAAAWAEFAGRYRDLLVRFCRRQGLQQADSEDVVQQVLASLARTLPAFVYSPQRGRFRDYLYRCTRNAIAQLGKSSRRAGIGEGGDPDLREDARAEAEAGRLWEQEWVAHHYRRAMDEVRATFEPRSVEIFDLSLEGLGVAELAARFEMSTQAVHKVRQRIRDRLQELLAAQVSAEEALHDR
jgi:RNA polymerase sigma factor (sigma-70 family)